MDRKVSTANLKVGMYISKLDRPWMQTPFLIQGFFIKDQAEISKLVEYCEYVFIDTELGEQAEMYIDSAPSAPGNQLKQRLSSNQQVENILDSGRRTIIYTDTKSTLEELPEARTAMGQATDRIARIVEHDIRNGKLDKAAVKEAVEPIVDSVVRNSDAFLWLSKMQDHDAYSYEHSVQNCALGIIFGRHIGLNKQGLNTLAMGLLLMDIGKIRLPKALLTKSTPLTEDETKVMQKHVAYSVEILRKSEGISEHIINIALTHHERYDGSGYPNGLIGTQTPAYGRMAAIIDCYDAMITSTPYRKAISEHKALQNLFNLSGKLFQTELVEQFIQCMGVYPTGSLVELSSGAVGAILSQNARQKMKPKILLLMDEEKHRYKKRHVLDLEKLETPLFISRGLENHSYGLDIKQVAF